jgi:hypothetical protein
MNDHIDVLREIIERPDGIKVTGNDHLQQILGSQPPLLEILGLGLRSRSYHDPDPALEQEIDDVSA